jgi:hypothetical protein
MNCVKELEWSFLTIAMAFLSNSYFLAETILKGSVFLVLMALTGIMGRVCAPMFLAQCAAFLNFRLFRNAKFVGISTLSFTFSDDFLSTFLHGLFLGIRTRYYFFDVLKNAQ